jgi:hypothetical protein
LQPAVAAYKGGCGQDWPQHNLCYGTMVYSDFQNGMRVFVLLFVSVYKVTAATFEELKAQGGHSWVYAIASGAV